tara:strand:+ start:273 stop:1184 length:912 start_codon:yes stop_codon:yes gene_type:complete
LKGKILILGGSGFIGSHLTKKCRDLGLECYSISINNNKLIRNFENVNYYKIDLSDFESTKELISNKEFSYIVNLSGYIDHRSFFNGGLDVFNSHFYSLINVLRCVKLESIKKIIHIGSSDEYGNITSPQNESLRESPISGYSLAKLSCTNLLQMLHRTENLPVIVLRLFLVYGEGQSEERFIPQVIKGCLENKKFPVSEGTQIRDFCHVDDVVEGIIASLQSSRQAFGNIINIASGKPVEVKSVINKILKLVGSGNPQFGLIPFRKDENMSLYADINKAKKLLDWQPKVNMSEGLNRTIKFYK